jgi:hypothetical protein
MISIRSQWFTERTFLNDNAYIDFLEYRDILLYEILFEFFLPPIIC